MKRKRDLDDTRQDEAHSRAANFGKWAQAGIATLREPRFWIALLVSQILSERLSVLLWTIDKYTTQDKHRLEDVPMEDRELENLAVLVFGKAQAIYESLLELRGAGPWRRVLEIAERLVPACSPKLQHVIHRMVLRLCGDYRRRIMDRIEEFPVAMLWLGHKSPSFAINGRLQCAKRLLQTPPDKMHITAVKVVEHFPQRASLLHSERRQMSDEIVRTI